MLFCLTSCRRFGDNLARSVKMTERAYPQKLSLSFRHLGLQALLVPLRKGATVHDHKNKDVDRKTSFRYDHSEIHSVNLKYQHFISIYDVLE